MAIWRSLFPFSNSFFVATKPQSLPTASPPTFFGQVDSDFQTPLHLAAANGHLEAVRALIAGGDGEIFYEDKYLMTPWHLACESG